MNSTANSILQRLKVKQVFGRMSPIPVKSLCEWPFICETSDTYMSLAGEEGIEDVPS